MNLLNDCAEEAEDKALDTTRKRSGSNLSALRNCTVTAMSNLLNANIDSGLMHAIGRPSYFIYFILQELLVA
jgi:neurofibromin 1